MTNRKLKKLLIVSLMASAFFLVFSICSYAAQIESLSVSDGLLRATLSEGNVRLYVADYDESVLSVAFFAKPNESGYVELEIGSADDCSIYLWEAASLKPLSEPYSLKGGRAYAKGSLEPVPEYTVSDPKPDDPKFVYDQSMGVVIVSSVSETELKGYQNGAEVSFKLSDEIGVVGYADSLDNVLPGYIVLPALNDEGICGEIDVMMTLALAGRTNDKGKPYYVTDPLSVSDKFGSHKPSDGSEEYINIVAEYVKDSLSVEDLSLKVNDGTDEVTYTFDSASSPIRRITLKNSKGITNVTLDNSTVSGKSLFRLSKLGSYYYYYNYLFLRYNTKTGRVTEAVLMCPHTSFGETTQDPDYSPWYRLEPDGSGGIVVPVS